MRRILKGSIYMTYQIISDSTCDLSPEQIERYNIRLIPLFVHLGDGEYRDGVDIHPDDIYAHVAAGGALASTAAVNLADQLTKAQEGAENLRRQVKTYLDEASRAKSEAAELRRKLQNAQNQNNRRG